MDGAQLFEEGGRNDTIAVRMFAGREKKAERLTGPLVGPQEFYLSDDVNRPGHIRDLMNHPMRMIQSMSSFTNL